MMRWILAAMFACAFLSGGGLHAAQIERKKVDVLTYSDFGEGVSLMWEDVTIPTREGVRQRLLIARGADAGDKAVILFKGGSGTPINYDEGEDLRFVDNFLVRSAPLFARAGFVTAIADAPSDRSGGMSDDFRASKEHHSDIRAAVDFLVCEGACEVVLIGTSRGTLSVAYLATEMTHSNVKGYVFTASVKRLAQFDLESIVHPVFMAHHAEDGCHAATYTGAQAAYSRLVKSPRRDFITVSGGDSPIDKNPCKARTRHGFLGKERKVVKEIVRWMNGEKPLEYLNS